MSTTTTQSIEIVLEKIQCMPLPEDEDLFLLRIREEKNCWRVSGILGPFAHTISDGQPCPPLCTLPLSDLEFSSEEEALDFARKVQDFLIERGKHPEGSTEQLLEGQSG